ncbi:MAG: 16S rRNA (guanine(966)-N(2))-methyltransferase RsmD [Candidatus Accumulibacter sp.]|nr:16S rRNA (guanine(966)-N(2))-methyltransferase RsmD [Accumulibacter sp.]
MNTVRIIGGAWRRRLLRFPDLDGLRPTPDRVRETLFNWLGQDLSGWSCLDLFAGSGALGFEAASRGAASVLLVDSSPKAVAALMNNVHLLDASGRMKIVRADAVRFARSATERFDLLFLDPPFHHGWFDQLADSVASVVKDDGLIYAEAERVLEGCGNWRTVRHGRAGQVCYHLMRRDADAP